MNVSTGNLGVINVSTMTGTTLNSNTVNASSGNVSNISCVNVSCTTLTGNIRPNLAAGTGVTLSTSGNVTTITSSASSRPYSFMPINNVQWPSGAAGNGQIIVLYTATTIASGSSLVLTATWSGTRINVAPSNTNCYLLVQDTGGYQVAGLINQRVSDVNKFNYITATFTFECTATLASRGFVLRYGDLGTDNNATTGPNSRGHLHVQVIPP